MCKAMNSSPTLNLYFMGTVPESFFALSPARIALKSAGRCQSLRLGVTPTCDLQGLGFRAVSGLGVRGLGVRV